MNDRRRREATESIREDLAKAKPIEARMLVADALKKGMISQSEAQRAVVDGRLSSDAIHKITGEISRRDDRKAGE